MIVTKTYPSGKVTWYRPRIVTHPGIARQPSPAAREIMRWNTCIMRWHGIEAAKQWKIELPESLDPRLVNTAKFQRPLRSKGSEFLSSNGKQRLRDGAAVLHNENPGSGWFAFDTLTFPPEFDGQHCQERLSGAINHFLTLLRQAYLLRGVVLRYQYVIELHPNRSRDSGIDVPHIHLLRNAAKSRFKWLLSYSEITDFWRRAVESAYIVTGDAEIYWGAATQTEAVKKSVGSYMAKYLSKGSPSQSHGGGGHQPLRLAQWWGQSRNLTRLIKLHIFVFKDEDAISLLQFCGRREQEYLRWELVLSEGGSAIAGSFTPRGYPAIRGILSVAGRLLRLGGRRVPDLYQGVSKVEKVGARVG